MISKPQDGIYDAVVDQELRDLLARYPELRTVFGKIEIEEQPNRYSTFVAGVIEQALKEEADPLARFSICNRIIEIIAGEPKWAHLQRRQLTQTENQRLLEITPPNYVLSGIPRPITSLTESSLFTGSPQEPQLVHELQKEMRSADSVDVLVSFIKWSGLRLLMPAFEDLRDRQIPVRLLTTSYMGASDAPAVEWLASLPNVRIRVSYDTEHTRLHAKAYYFKRLSGFSTAYIGSANMSHVAMTSGLEWNLKVTAQDMKHILEKFTAEFETYWNGREFIPFDAAAPERFRGAIERARGAQNFGTTTFFDLTPHAFQERILDALDRERSNHDRWRNLVIAATGTGKTVIAAFDFRKYYFQMNKQARLLFVAHRQEILEQSLHTFRNVLRDSNFGELLVGNHQPGRHEHLFCSVGMLSSRALWTQVGSGFYDYIVIDEAHHGAADSYRPIFDNFSPKILLGLTATPERMDGQSIAVDFGNRFAAEVRLPEALEEKLLCPFHYFGIADPVALDQDRFWRNGRYDTQELEQVYTGAHILAQQRLDAIAIALERYEPDINRVKGIGFCVSIGHAKYMAQMFSLKGIKSAALVSGVGGEQRSTLLADFKAGRLTFLFTVDVLNEGLDVPEVNTVMFLRPTESLTVFLQQLGRGLRHAPGKDCLTVLDFVGQAHRRSRLDSKFKALLPTRRFSIDREVESEFPHLPAGCSIQLDRLSRQYVLANIRSNLRNLAVQLPDRLQTFSHETGQPLTFNNFIRYHDYEPETLLVSESWSGWKAKAQLAPVPQDEDLGTLQPGLVRAAFVSGPKEIVRFRTAVKLLKQGSCGEALEFLGEDAIRLHYRIWGKPGKSFGLATLAESFLRISKNSSILSDLEEILDWSELETTANGRVLELPFPCPFELHAKYGSNDIKAALGLSDLSTGGQTGVGVFHLPGVKAYVFMVTFQKTEREYSPSTMYADYPISRDLLHWETQSVTSQNSATGQNLIHSSENGYTILVFARDQKKRNGVAVPFTYLGDVGLVSYESERPIRMVWRLNNSMPVEMFEENRRGG